MTRHKRSFVTCFALVLAWASTSGHADPDGRLQSLKDKAADYAAGKANEVLGKIKEASGEISSAGYEIDRVYVDIGLQPAVEVRFILIRKVTEDEMKTILERNKDDKKLSAVLKSLFSVNRIDVSGFKVEGVDMFISLPPKTRLVLSPDDDE